MFLAVHGPALLPDGTPGEAVTPTRMLSRKASQARPAARRRDRRRGQAADAGSSDAPAMQRLLRPLQLLRHRRNLFALPKQPIGLPQLPDDLLRRRPAASLRHRFSDCPPCPTPGNKTLEATGPTSGGHATPRHYEEKRDEILRQSQSLVQLGNVAWLTGSATGGSGCWTGQHDHLSFGRHSTTRAGTRAIRGNIG